jgi:hypothetical protein
MTTRAALSVALGLAGCASYPALPPPVAGESHVVIARPEWYPHEVQLHARDGEKWKVACTAPCEQKLDTAREYRVDAPMMDASQPIRLTSAPKTEIAVQPSASYARPLAMVIAGAGMGSIAAGAILGARAGVFDDPGDCGVCTVVTGMFLLGGALLALAGGFIGSRAHTRVEVSPLPAPRQRASARR